MSVFIAFVKKEFVEFSRTYKLMILGLVFLMFGIMNPLIAKFTPEIIAQFMPAGMEIVVAEPTVLDSWAQFYKNVPQLGLFVLVILFSGMMASEYSRGTLVHILTKGLQRKTVIFAKFSAAVVLWSGAYVLCFLTSFAYTWCYWREEAAMKGLAEGIAGLWLFGVFLLAVVILGSILFRNAYGSLLFAGSIVVAQFLIGMVPKIKDFLPIQLTSLGMVRLQGQIELADFIKPVLTSAVGVIICLFVAVLVFNKKKL